MKGGGEYTAANLCVAVQPFIKLDTTLATLESIRRMCGGHGTTLLVMQDGIEGARNEAEKRDAHSACVAAVGEWCAAHESEFARIENRRVGRNLGAYAGARAVVDAALEMGDWVLFAEDDVLFCDTALDWFLAAINSDIFARADVWAVAGESKAFDARGAAVDSERLESDRRRAAALDLMSRYVLFDFLPSTCFATTREKWVEFGETRGSTNGDVAVNKRCRDEGRRSLWPVIARCHDIGMHHPLGYSMMMRKGNAATIPGKSVYLLADHFARVTVGFTPLEKSLNGLFTEWRAT